MKNTETLSTAFLEFVAIISKLRKECPWDKVQTHQTLRAPLLEETHEAIEAIDNEDYPELKKELGDILLHIVFHADLANEEGHFNLQEVIEGESAKLIYRHPHVFGTTEVRNADDVAKNWEQLKRKESGRTSVLDGVPAALPALQRAGRIQEKAAKVGFDWENADQIFEKFDEEVSELRAAIKNGDTENAAEEIGDLLFVVMNLSRHLDVEPETALKKTNRKFRQRFKFIEDELKREGKTLDSADLKEMDDLWNKAKAKKA